MHMIDIFHALLGQFGKDQKNEDNENPATAQNAIALIISVIAVSLTEARMSRSRARFSFARLLAPIGIIGFLGVIKVQIATLIPFKIAKDLDMKVKNIASASKIGSIRCMNYIGIDWNKDVNCSTISMDDSFPLKINDKFKFERESQVKYISSRTKVEVIRRENVQASNFDRKMTMALLWGLQTLLLFIVVHISDLVGKRKESTLLGILFCASVSVAELTTSIVEFMWTSISTAEKNVLPEQPVQNETDKSVESLRIYEQKARVSITRAKLRQYRITRLVQIRLNNFYENTEGLWLIDRAKIHSKENAGGQNADADIAFPPFKKYSILILYYSARIIGSVCILVEIFLFAIYVTPGFAPPLEDLKLVKDHSSNSSEGLFFNWFFAQLSIFLFKAFAPFLDKRMTKPTDPVASANDDFGFRVGDAHKLTSYFAINGRIRAGNKVGTLLQTTEQVPTKPFQFNSVFPLTLVKCRPQADRIPEMPGERKIVVPQILLLSGIGVKFVEMIMQDPALARFNSQINSDAVYILRFIPDNVSDPDNKTKKVDIAVIKTESILEKYHYRIVTARHKTQYVTDFLVWDGVGGGPMTEYRNVQEMHVLFFNSGNVNGEAGEVVMDAKTYRNSEMPIPKDWSPPDFKVYGVNTRQAAPQNVSSDSETNSETTTPSIPKDVRALGLFDTLACASVQDAILGCRYVGQFDVQNCYIHRYYSLITAQGRLSEASIQSYGADLSDVNTFVTAAVPMQNLPGPINML